ncbi:urea active transporter [Bulinus truncatus]|nr:urea active transporter [Bulinus truncatus]
METQNLNVSTNVSAGFFVYFYIYDCQRQPLEMMMRGLSKVYPVLNNHQAAGLLLIGFGGFSVLLALLYVAIRKHVFHDADNLDTTFDAGGKVSTSLTAVTVASQLLWPGDLLQSATVAIKNGIAGSFWYTSCAVVNMILFPVLSVQFKTRAPGAKTFLQVIHARFGFVAHIVFCFFALLMNLMVTICLLTASTALLQALVKDASGEYCVLIMATLFAHGQTAAGDLQHRRNVCCAGHLPDDHSSS